MWMRMRGRGGANIRERGHGHSDYHGQSARYSRQHTHIHTPAVQGTAVGKLVGGCVDSTRGAAILENGGLGLGVSSRTVAKLVICVKGENGHPPQVTQPRG